MEKQEFNKSYKKLVLRFVISMILIATILITKQTIINYQIKQEEDTAYIVNIAGRQRMLSQKITKDIAFIASQDDNFNKDLYVEDLKTSINLWETSHNELLLLNKKVNYLGSNLDKEITGLFKEIEPSYNKIVTSSKNIIKNYQNNNLTGVSSEAEKVYTTEATYLSKMDNIVKTYEKEALLSIKVIKKTQFLLFGLVFIMLIFVVFKIVFPLLRYLRKSFEKSTEYSENLSKIFNSMYGAIFIVNLDGDIILMNETAKSINPLPNSDFKISPLSQYMTFLNTSVEEIISKFDNDVERVDDFEVIVKDINSNIKNFVMSAFKTTYKGEKVFVISLFDITSQKQAEQILENIALRDELTGLYNRHFLNSIISEEIIQSNVYNLPLSIALVDLDNFKYVNDDYGHPVGDEVLKMTAETIDNNLDPSHHAIRFGGEEFLLLMPNTKLDEAVVVTENFRKELEGKRHKKAGKITASVGVAQLNGESNFNDLYARVDAALYKAKSSGKNKIKLG